MEVSINMSDKEKPFKGIPKRKDARKIDKPKKKVKWFLIPVTVIVAVVLTFGFYMLYRTYKVSSNIGLQLTPGSIFSNEQKDPELKKDSTGKYTNVMLVGIDTRENSSLLNTDTIIVASYNHETKNVVMISVPRDLHVQVNPDVVWFNRINSVYGTYEQKESGTGLENLKRVVEEVTSTEIQYYGMIDYKGFVELIDAVGGIYVNVENSFTDYMYPQGNGYQTVSFKSGPQLMDGDTALKFSRSRHSMQNGEGSDFMRAKRQQKVLMAFKDTILSSETLLNPQKITDLMSAVQNNLKISTFTLGDIEAGITILKDFDSSNGNTYSFVLDPVAGNYTLLTDDNVVNTGAYAIGPVAGLGKYDDIHKYVDFLLTEPQLYSENPSIYVYNVGLGYQESYKKTQELREEFKFLNVKFLGTLFSNKEGRYIYSNKTDQFTTSIERIAQYLNTENKIKPEYITSKLHGESITILLGKEVVNTNSQVTSETSN